MMKSINFGFGFILLLVLSVFFLMVLSGCSVSDGAACDGTQMVDEGAVGEPDLSANDLEENTNEVDAKEKQENVKQEPEIDMTAINVKWPETKVETIIIEGMEETKNLKRFVDTNGYFLTYRPEDMVAVQGSLEKSETGTKVSFYANYQGDKREDAHITILVLEKADPVIDAIYLEEKVADWGYKLDREINPALLENAPWARDAGVFSDATYAGSVYLGEHNACVFLVKVHYPHEFGDGMEARQATILENFYWLDSGTYLIQ